MGIIIARIMLKVRGRNSNSFLSDDPPDSTRIRFSSSINSEPTISIPTDPDMDQSADKRIKFRVRHAASDLLATVEAHKDHRVSMLKQYLIENMGMPFPSEDGKCKIWMVWNKAHLTRDEPIDVDDDNKLNINQRYLGGSIDHLRLGEYGLDNGDALMFTVVFPQIFKSAAN